MPTAIIAITANGAELGARLHREIPGSTLFVLEKHATDESKPFSERLPVLAERLWSQHDAFVFIMATGIVVRSIASLVKAKDTDPAVVVVDDAGKFAISLLSGHIGGANDLANVCAKILGSTPVVTTATDVNDLPSFDMLAKEKGWVIDDLSRVRVLNSLLLEGKEIAVVDFDDAVRRYCGGKALLSFHESFAEAVASGADGRVFVTNRIPPQEICGERNLVLRPLNLYLGIGCNRGTSAEEIESVVTDNLERLSLSIKSVRCIATARAKDDEAGLLAFAGRVGLPLRFFESSELNNVDVPSPPSAHAFSAIGANGVAEPAAILASGGGILLLHKVKEGNVTLAIAESGAG